MAHQVVRRADQLVASEATDFGEDVVAVGDLPFQVGGRDEALLVGKAYSRWDTGWLLRIDFSRLALNVRRSAPDL